MNCVRFEQHVVELARGELMDAALRGQAGEHVAGCQACAARLSGERELTQALRAMNQNDARASAPPRVEAALLAAFRASREGRTGDAEVAPMSVPAAHNTSTLLASRRKFLAPAAAVAASVALVMFAAWLYAQLSPASVAPPPVPEIAAAAGPAATPRRDTTTVPPGSTEATPEPPSKSNNKKIKTPRKQPARPAPVKNESPPLRFDETMTVSGASETAANSSGTNAGEAEGLTDFFPLNGDNRSTPVESGQLVRVQVPRASLAGLGLPFNAVRAGESISAEVLLSEDGVARAIRFVR
ncbi:MAG: anti-sigma factor family protein [Pyrinomonadaceae bacterium]